MSIATAFALSRRAVLSAMLAAALSGCGVAPEEASPPVAADQAPLTSLGTCEQQVAGYISTTVSTANIATRAGVSNAHRFMLIDAITTAAAGQPGLIDAVLSLSTTDPDIRFVAPTPANMPNSTTYFHKEGTSWAGLSPDQVSATPEVQIRTYEGQGALTPPVPVTNGATFGVGVRYLSGVPHPFSFNAKISYRPNWLKPGTPRNHTFTP